MLFWTLGGTTWTKGPDMRLEAYSRAEVKKRWMPSVS